MLKKFIFVKGYIDKIYGYYVYIIVYVVCL